MTLKRWGAGWWLRSRLPGRRSPGQVAAGSDSVLFVASLPTGRRACGELPQRDPERDRRSLWVRARPLEQLLGDQRGARELAGTLIGIRAGKLATEHIAGVGAHVQHERRLGIAGRAAVELATEDA